MDDQEFQDLADANYARRASRLLRFIARRREYGVAPDPQDLARVEWLKNQLIASRRGARSIVRERIRPDEEPLKSSFSSEQTLFRFFRLYSGTRDPVEHARWVDDIVAALSEVVTAEWDSLSPANQAAINDKLEPLLLRLTHLSSPRPDPSGIPLPII